MRRTRPPAWPPRSVRPRALRRRPDASPARPGHEAHTCEVVVAEVPARHGLDLRDRHLAQALEVPQLVLEGPRRLRLPVRLGEALGGLDIERIAGFRRD